MVAPGRPVDPVVATRAGAFAAIAYPEVELVFHPQCFLSEGHFAGPDAARAAALVEVANDPGYDAVWFARGGYGSNRLLAQVMPQLAPAAARKIYAGYSDMGFLLGALYARRIGRPCHAPMATDINRAGGDATVARTLGWIARGDPQGLEPDLGQRPAAAFNLSILHALTGTPFLPDLTDHVLLIEEVSEPLYAVDRMLFTLAHATQLKGVAGVRLGAVSDIVANDPPWGETLETMILRWCGEMGVPYLGRARIGHTQDNHVVPFGIA
ncbi:peptidase S66 [Sphingomonas metalli]|uniref:Peptidase S66 n=1 Tax=Sphingomonas metalli TaxID=1779358 RepID=A0A916SWH6_9SPHN|nr:peptidase S66 [Sphingomonas metalli]